MSKAAAVADSFVPTLAAAAADSAPVPAARAAARPRSAVAQWKRQLTWFAATLTALVVLVAGLSAAALWLVITEVESVQAADEARSRAAVDTRLAVVEVESLLARTIAEADPARVRAAAVASIAAASRLEDAVSALRSALPGNANAEEMGRLVDSVKEPRVQVIVLARKGARAEATAAREAIAEPLKRIDAVSSSLLEEQAATRQRAGQQRATLFQQMLGALLAMAVLSTVGGLWFYRRLKRRFAPVEQLLEAVAHSAGELAAGGQELDGLNGEVQQSNRTLRVLLDRFQEAAQSMTQEADGCLQGVEQLDRTCRESAGMSRRHAEEAAGVATQIHATTARLHALLETTHALSRSRSDITRFADQIETISFTTRILSLNAAVEAARAGAAGRGFSVIASSVRRLSEDTQEAALQIRRASEDITHGLDATAKAVQETSALMDTGAVRIAALDSSARSNQALAEGMHHEVQGFRGTFQRQVEQVRSMDHASQAVAGELADGDRHARLLDATSSALAQTSSALLQRLSNLQA